MCIFGPHHPNNKKNPFTYNLKTFYCVPHEHNSNKTNSSSRSNKKICHEFLIFCFCCCRLLHPFNFDSLFYNWTELIFQHKLPFWMLLLTHLFIYLSSSCMRTYKDSEISIDSLMNWPLELISLFSPYFQLWIVYG